MELRRFLMLLSICLIIILLIVVWFFPANDDFHSENPFWNGAKDMVSIITATPVSTLSGLPSPPDESTLILVPYLELTTAELEELRTFIDQGGTLVLADDYGFGNQILEYLGLQTRFAGSVLLDPLFNYKNEWFPKISHFTPDPITNYTECIVLNHATCLTGVESNNVVARSSSFSFLDINSNQVRDEGEPTGPLPVISHDRLGNGQLILISDPSIFINSMGDIEDNINLIRNIAATAESRLLIDQSHLPPSNLSGTKNLIAYVRDFLSAPAGTIGLVIVVLAITMIPVLRRKEGPEEDEKRDS